MAVLKPFKKKILKTVCLSSDKTAFYLNMDGGESKVHARSDFLKNSYNFR